MTKNSLSLFELLGGEIRLEELVGKLFEAFIQLNDVFKFAVFSVRKFVQEDKFEFFHRFQIEGMIYLDLSAKGDVFNLDST